MRQSLVLCLLFALATTGPVGAHGNPPSVTGEREPLELASVHAAVGPIDNEATWFAKRSGYQVPIASLTKLMTALVVLDSGEPLDEWLEVVDRGDDPPNNAYSRIRIGSELTRRNLLRIGLMSSENLAVHVLASHHPGGRAAFIEAMNRKAEELGMDQARFVDPSGLSPDNVASAEGVLRLVRAAYQHREIRRLSTTTYHRARFRAPRYALAYGNTNPLLNNPNWDVSLTKTGYLVEAGRCLAMVATVADHQVAMVFINSKGTRTPLGDAGRTRRWLNTGDAEVVADTARRYEEQQAQQLPPSTGTTPTASPE